MTVCIVAVCTHRTDEGDWPMIVGASDRMYTASAGAREPTQTKQYTLGRSSSSPQATAAASARIMTSQTMSDFFRMIIYFPRPELCHLRPPCRLMQSGLTLPV